MGKHVTQAWPIRASYSPVCKWAWLETERQILELEPEPSRKTQTAFCEKLDPRSMNSVKKVCPLKTRRQSKGRPCSTSFHGALVARAYIYCISHLANQTYFDQLYFGCFIMIQVVIVCENLKFKTMILIHRSRVWGRKEKKQFMWKYIEVACCRWWDSAAPTLERPADCLIELTKGQDTGALIHRLCCPQAWDSPYHYSRLHTAFASGLNETPGFGHNSKQKK